MSHTPKVGDKFRLLGMEWTVRGYTPGDVFLHACSMPSHYCSLGDTCWDKLDWIEPEVPKLTKAQAEKAKQIIRDTANPSDMYRLIDAMTE